MRKKTLKEFIEMAKDSKNYWMGYTGIAWTALGIAFADVENDEIAWSMTCDSYGETVVYTWMEKDGNITGCRRQLVKYGKKPDACDGEDLAAYVVKYGRKYWMDEMVRYL